MGEVIQFSDYCKGCKSCANLRRMEKDTYICTAMQWDDGETVVPIADGEKTDGYNICNGEEYIRRRVMRSGQRDSI